jgi:hypothetical protein
MYRLLVMGKLEQSAAMFIGLPAFLAILVTLTPAARTTTGLLLKATTVVLLTSAVLLAEGFVCVMMAAPLFYGVAALIGLIFDYLGRRGIFRRVPQARMTLAALPALFMGLEGTPMGFEFEREEAVTASSN